MRFQSADLSTKVCNQKVPTCLPVCHTRLSKVPTCWPAHHYICHFKVPTSLPQYIHSNNMWLAYNYIQLYTYMPFQSGERGGSVVECRTPEREVRGSKPTAAVLCPWARHFTPRKYWLITQEAMAPSRHDWKIVDWDVKPQHNQPFQSAHLPTTSSQYMQSKIADLSTPHAFPKCRPIDLPTNTYAISKCRPTDLSKKVCNQKVPTCLPVCHTCLPKVPTCWPAHHYIRHFKVSTSLPQYIH